MTIVSLAVARERVRKRSADRLLFNPIYGFWSTRYGWVRDASLADHYAPGILLTEIPERAYARGARLVNAEEMICEPREDFAERVWELASERREVDPDQPSAFLSLMSDQELARFFNSMQARQVAYPDRTGGFYIESKHN